MESGLCRCLYLPLSKCVINALHRFARAGYITICATCLNMFILSGENQAICPRTSLLISCIQYQVLGPMVPPIGWFKEVYKPYSFPTEGLCCPQLSYFHIMTFLSHVFLKITFCSYFNSSLITARGFPISFSLLYFVLFVN